MHEMHYRSYVQCVLGTVDRALGYQVLMCGLPYYALLYKTAGTCSAAYTWCAPYGTCFYTDTQLIFTCC